MKQLIYTPNDLAYIQGTAALHKKIDVLAEQSHSNDAQAYSLQDEMRDEYAAVQEINTVLTNYVQTKDLQPNVDMSDYPRITSLNNYYTKTESDNRYTLKGETNYQHSMVVIFDTLDHILYLWLNYAELIIM